MYVNDYDVEPTVECNTVYKSACGSSQLNIWYDVCTNAVTASI